MVHDLLNFFTQFGAWGVMFGLMIIIIPSEIVLAYAGFLVATTDISFWEAFIFGMIGGTIAQIFVYWIARYGGRPFLDRYGKFFLIKKHHVDLSEDWFNRYGKGVVFTARFVPIIHHAISIPAGLTRMRLNTFTIYTALGLAPWTFLFIYLGKTLGTQWENINQKAGPYLLQLIIAAISLTVLYFVYMWWKRKKKGNPIQGYIGEKNTALMLKELGSDFRVLHGRSVRSRGAAEDIDHLIIGSNGIFHIETKNWHGAIHFTDHGIERSQPEHHEDPNAQLERQAFILKELVRANKLEADVTGILNFADPQCDLKGGSSTFTTVKLDQLVAAITKYKPVNRLNAEEMRAVAKVLEEHSKPSVR
ncbi:MAG: VTT domain-containing protein [Paenibacillaceae bacterium]